MTRNFPTAKPVTLSEARMSLRAEKIAADIHLFELRDPGGGELPQFTAGAHLTVRSPNGSLRKYSLCNDPAERDRYVIAVKRDPAGRGGSVDLVDNTRPGDLVEGSAPHNAFELAERAPSFILIAGGIGITPILSMARQLNGEGRRYKLYYLTRSPELTAFRDELAGDDFKGKVVIHHDAGDPAQAFDLWPILEKPTAAHVYCCGPRPLLEAVRDMTGHWSPAGDPLRELHRRGRRRERPRTSPSRWCSRNPASASRCRPASRSSRPCASAATRRRARARAAPAAPAARASSRARPTIATSCSWTTRRRARS